MIGAGCHLGFRCSADKRRAEITDTLMVRGEGGLAPGERDLAALACSAKIGGRLGEFERRRQWGAGLRAAGEDEAKRRRDTRF